MAKTEVVSIRVDDADLTAIQWWIGQEVAMKGETAAPVYKVLKTKAEVVGYLIAGMLDMTHVRMEAEAKKAAQAAKRKASAEARKAAAQNDAK